MERIIYDRIIGVLNEWNRELRYLNNKEIIALNFGGQLVYNGYELYFTGHTSFDKDDDLWLFDEGWAPDNNYISLGEESLAIDRLEFLEEYENIVKLELANSKELYRDFIVTVSFVDSVFIQLK